MCIRDSPYAAGRRVHGGCGLLAGARVHSSLAGRVASERRLNVERRQRFCGAVFMPMQKNVHRDTKISLRRPVYCVISNFEPGRIRAVRVSIVVEQDPPVSTRYLSPTSGGAFFLHPCGTPRIETSAAVPVAAAQRH